MSLTDKRAVVLTESEWVDIMRALNHAGLISEKHSWDRTISEEMQKFYECESNKFYRLAKCVMNKEDK